MWERAGLIRSEEGLRDGLKEVYALQREVEGDSAVAALRLRRALLAARGILEYALAHYRSRGYHYGGDSGEATDLRPT
jgi:succinate dehydrogenase/fumarate reductase flavoprotein subunit